MNNFRNSVFCVVILLSLMFLATGCIFAQDPGTPPEEVLHPNGETSESGAYSAEMLRDAVTVRIGHGSQVDWHVDMMDNAAVHTMLNYVSGSLLFPTYTYDETAGFVAQRIQGTYSRDDEVEVKDIHAGELYLFSGNQLRLYFKDVEDADITATPVGIFAEVAGENITDAVIWAYEFNRGDVWGVDVYFTIRKNIK